ncbi:MAG: rod shape-determining protein RodA [Armatimonadetes bacterium]|nr:rod shape-determining protein RodA [Armatimonadota bacterium]
MDWLLLLSAGFLLGIGLLALWSASEVQVDHEHFKKQLIWIAVSLPVLFMFLWVDPRIWGYFSRVVYALSLLLLILVLVPGIGKELSGAQRWIDLGPLQFQPSEAAKLLLVLTLADFFARRHRTLRTPSGMSLSLLHVLPFFVLVFLQPDLGTSIIFICIWFGLSFVAGQRLAYMAAVSLAMILTFGAAWNFGVFEEYQKERLTALISGEGSYHSEMSIRSVASGQSLGQGFGQGAMTEARLVPEQTTDFIFAAIAEEGGFVGSALIVGAFALFLWRVWTAVVEANVRVFRYMAAGIFVVFSFHILVNLLMVVGLLPIVGVPLTFMSYGGSAMVLNMAMLGLLLNLRARETRLVF